MQIEIGNKLKKKFYKDQFSDSLFTDIKVVTTEYGKQVYKTFKVVYAKLKSAEFLSDLKGYKKCKELQGERKGQLSMRLDRKWRLIFEPMELVGQNIRKPDKGLDWSKVTTVRVLEIADYH